MGEVHPLVEKWNDEGIVEHAVTAAEARAFALMRRMEGGIPARVMFAGNLMAFDRYAQQLTGMFMDVTSHLFGWTDLQKSSQLNLSLQLFELIKQDSLVTVLENEAMTREVRDAEARDSEDRVHGGDTVEGETEGEAESDRQRDVHAEGLPGVEGNGSRVPETPSFSEDTPRPGVLDGEVLPEQDGTDDGGIAS